MVNASLERCIATCSLTNGRSGRSAGRISGAEQPCFSIDRLHIGPAEEVKHVQASDDEDDEDFHAELSDGNSSSSASSSESEMEQEAEAPRLNARELAERYKGALQLKAPCRSHLGKLRATSWEIERQDKHAAMQAQAMMCKTICWMVMMFWRTLLAR